MQRCKRAFTLIELLVVIAIIAILAAILFPVFAQAREAAKDTVQLSNTKQMALAQMMYAGDADDNPPLTMWIDASAPGGSNGGYPWTWQMMSMPYMKNMDVYYDAKMPRRSSTTKAIQDFIMSQHQGMPVRATAVRNNATTNPPEDFFVTGPAWSGIVGEADPMIRFTGIGGVGVRNASPGSYVGLRYQVIAADNIVPSIPLGSIELPSDTIMIAGAGNYDMFMGNARFVGGRSFYCNSGYGAAADAAWPGTKNILGLHARKRKDSFGDGNYPVDCFYPNGMAVFATTDGSARAMNLRRAYEIRSVGGQRVFYRLWPQGGF